MKEIKTRPIFTFRKFFPLEILLSFFKDLSVKDIWHFAITCKENYNLIFDIQNTPEFYSVVKEKALEYSFNHQKFDIKEHPINGRTDNVIKLSSPIFIIAQKKSLLFYDLETKKCDDYPYPDRKPTLDYTKIGPRALLVSPGEKYLALGWSTESCIMVFDIKKGEYLPHVPILNQTPPSYFQLLGFIEGDPILSFAETFLNPHAHINFNTYNVETGEQLLKNSVNINQKAARLFGSQQNLQYFIFPSSIPVSYHKILGYPEQELSALEPGTLSLERISTPEGTVKIRISRLLPLGNGGYTDEAFNNRLLDSSGPYYQKIIQLWENNQPIEDPHIIQHILGLLERFARVCLQNQCQGIEILSNPLDQHSSQSIKTPPLGEEILDVLVSNQSVIFVLSKIKTTVWLNKILIEKNNVLQISKIQLMDNDSHILENYYLNSMKIHGELLCIQPIVEIRNNKTILLIDIKTLQKWGDGICMNQISTPAEYSRSDILRYDDSIKIPRRTFFTDSPAKHFLIQNNSNSTSTLVELTPHKFKPNFWTQQPQSEEGNFEEKSNNTQSMSMD